MTPSKKTTKQPAGKVRIRRWRKSDIPTILDIESKAYANLPNAHLSESRHFEAQLKAFPEGQLLATIDDKVVGYTATLIVQLADDTIAYSYTEITGDGTFTTHNGAGDTLYGADMAVLPEYQGQGIAKALYKARIRLLRRLNLRRMIAGGRIPGYNKHAGKLTAEQYVKKVVEGELTDPTLTPQIKSGYTVRGVFMDYLEDHESLNYATFLEYQNDKYDATRRQISAALITRSSRKVRICAAQYEISPVSSWEEFEKRVSFFVSTADEYHCHFLLFPELFTVQLFSMFDPNTETRDAMRLLADYHDKYVEMFTAFAKKTRLYIFGGSHPVVRDGKIYNVAHLFSPEGNVYTQDKLHITPDERNEYGIEPGTGLSVFETPFCRVGIQVCYDIEFPEVSRLLTLSGAELIMVPFSTDDRKAYQRVRFTAQARAIENWIYLALAGNVGNLPGVSSFLINYGQAVVITPCDIPFPINGIQAESDSNTETVVITDLDLGDLAYRRMTGSVRPLHDRRVDLYDLKCSEKVSRIRVT